MKSNFDVEINFTKAYKENINAHPAIREAKCVAEMFPAALSPIEGDDLFAGRFICSEGVDKIRGNWNPNTEHITGIGFLGLAAGAGPSAGYYCHDEVIDKKIEALNPSEDVIAELAEIKEFWKTETIHYKTRSTYSAEMQEALPYDNWSDGKIAANPAHPLYRMAGPHWDWDKLMLEGIPGMKSLVCEYRKKSEDKELFDGILLSLENVCNVCKFYAEQAEELAELADCETRKKELLEMKDVLLFVTENKPETLRQAMQLMMIYAVVSGAYAFGRMDEYFGDFYVNDLDKGNLTEESALKLTQSIWQLINDNGAPFDNRVIIGGKGRRNEENANKFAHIAIEATRTVLVPLPQLTLRFYKGQDESLYEHSMKSISEGRTHPMLYNDDVNIPSVQKAMSVSYEMAEQYLPYGCGEYVLYKKSFATPSGIFNILKILECVLRNGHERLTDRTVGIPKGELKDFTTFEDLYSAFAENVEYWCDMMAEQEKLEYDIVGKECGFNLWTLLFDNCLEKGKSVFNGGLEHLSGTLESYGQINAADALYAIKKLVYDEKKISAEDLIKATDEDFVGYENIQKMLLEVPKYGNDIDEVDQMVRRVHKTVCLNTQKQAKKYGMDSYLIVIINNAANTVLGRHTLASPDGRKAFTYTANGNNPQPGNDISGVTAFLNSIVKFDTDIHAGASQNMKFGAEMFSEKLYPKLKDLLSTYWKKGGAQAMLTVLNKNDLENAIKEPAKYANLMVRVGGWSARFVEIDEDIQQEVLHRTFNNV